MMCYYLNVHFRGQRIKNRTLRKIFRCEGGHQRRLEKVVGGRASWFVTFKYFYVGQMREDVTGKVCGKINIHGIHATSVSPLHSWLWTQSHQQCRTVYLFPYFYVTYDGPSVRVSGYRYRGLGFDSRRYQIFWVVVGLERGPLSLVRSIEELLE